jgi:hypothetical protein
LVPLGVFSKLSQTFHAVVGALLQGDFGTVRLVNVRPFVTGESDHIWDSEFRTPFDRFRRYIDNFFVVAFII